MTLTNDLTLVEHDQPVAVLRRDGQIVHDRQNRLALFAMGLPT